uniref:Uncharacterized protein n=1 Tax=Anguilla anguilla TaxID=7936 RepID=A0A0E9SYR7_ANGAN
MKAEIVLGNTVYSLSNVIIHMFPE